MSKIESNRSIFFLGARHGVPIALGYFAVAFSLGITARNCGFSPFQGFLSSYMTYASAGQYIGYTLYVADASLLQLVVMMIITNLRYLLMGCALNQRLEPDVSFGKRLLTGLCITDEIFGITIARPGSVNPYYMLGAWMIAEPFWASGTALGIAMGNILPSQIVSALSVALYGMFLAVIIPPARKDKIVCLFVVISFAASYAATRLPGISNLSAGNRTILLTVVISAIAAVAFPRTNAPVADPLENPEEDGAIADRLQTIDTLVQADIATQEAEEQEVHHEQ